MFFKKSTILIGLMFLFAFFSPFAKVSAEEASVEICADGTTICDVEELVKGVEDVDQSPDVVLAQEITPTIYFFGSDGCPHCQAEKKFFEGIAADYPDLQVNYYEINEKRDNLRLFVRMGKYFDANVSGVPFTVIGSETFAGFGSAETTGVNMIAAIEGLKDGTNIQPFVVTDDYNVVAVGEQQEKEQKLDEETLKDLPTELKIPLTNFTISTRGLSLTGLTVAIALVDGFNPCAMWVLLFLISLLLGYESRRRMWILGLTFLLASGLVNFLFMSAWLEAFLFIGYLYWIRILIGGLALAAGIYSLRQFYLHQTGCIAEQNEGRLAKLNKLREIAKKENLLIAMIGIAGLAFAVNLIEAICSAGLPAIYTHILSSQELSRVGYYSYIGLYQLIFLFDDITVFVIAMVTLQQFGIESKYAKWTKLIGGIIMFLIGAALILNPNLLLFG